MSRQLLLSILSVFCLNCGPGSPDLPPSAAAKIISSSPGFNRYRRLVSVETTRREADSLAGCCYNADFTFQVIGAHAAIVPATADFNFVQGRWYLNEFSYGKPPDAKIVEVHDGPDQVSN